MVDDYRKAKKAGDAKAALLSKDKTRSLQFIPGIHIFEQGLLHLLSLASVPADQWQNLSPEDMVRKVAAVNPDVFFSDFLPSSVPPCATQQSVDAAFSLSRWFQSVYLLRRTCRSRAPKHLLRSCRRRLGGWIFHSSCLKSVMNSVLLKSL